MRHLLDRVIQPARVRRVDSLSIIRRLRSGILMAKVELVRKSKVEMSKVIGDKASIPRLKHFVLLKSKMEKLKVGL